MKLNNGQWSTRNNENPPKCLTSEEGFLEIKRRISKTADSAWVCDDK